MDEKATLRGGPVDGMTVWDCGTTIQVTGYFLPPGFVARYKPQDRRKRRNEIYVFEGLSEVAVTLPRPGRAEAA